MVLDWWSFLLLLGVIQGSFLIAVLLFKKEGNLSAHRLLAGLLGIVVLQLFTYLLISTGLYETMPHLINAGIPFLFLIGPLYYYYLKCLLENDCAFRLRDIGHLVPFVAAAIYYLPFYLQPAETKIQMVRQLESLAVVDVPIETLLFVGLHTLQTGIYIGMALLMLKSYHEMAQEPVLNGKRLKLNWLKQFSAAFLAYWIISLLSLVLLDFMDSYAPEIDYVVFLSLSVFVSAIAYVGIKRSELFSESISGTTSPKYQSSPLDKEQAESIVEEIKAIMNSDRLYLQNDLRLSDLADALDIHPNYLSQIINQELGLSFNDFVNSYRVKEAQKRFRSPEIENKTILAVAYEVGFNNKNSFNKAFKKFTGTTPSSFIHK